MKLSHLTQISAVLLFSISQLATASSLPKSVNEELSMCATDALGDLLADDAVIHIDISDMESTELHRSIRGSSEKMTTLSMSIANNVSGEELGDLICVLDHRGRVVRSMFEKDLSGVASN